MSVPQKICVLLFFSITIFLTYQKQVAVSSTNAVDLVEMMPINDNCSTPYNIPIAENGYGIGTFTTDPISITDATKEPNEFFIEFGTQTTIDDKSIWYEFSIPTRRFVTIKLKQVGDSIAVNQVGFTTYLTTNCFPTMGDSEASLLTPINKFGDTGNNCLEPGNYRIQVTANQAAKGSIFLELQVAAPFGGDVNQLPYDLTNNAYDFGVLTTERTNVEHKIECHSIDGTWEYDCLPANNRADFQSSTWYTLSLIHI